MDTTLTLPETATETTTQSRDLSSTGMNSEEVTGSAADLDAPAYKKGDSLEDEEVLSPSEVQELEFPGNQEMDTSKSSPPKQDVKASVPPSAASGSVTVGEQPTGTNDMSITPPPTTEK